MTLPTVGRVVWFYVFVAGQGHKGPFAALVAKVLDDGKKVNLRVIWDNGEATARKDVLFVQEEAECPASDYASWMPYQIGQAKKAEELKEQIAAAKQQAAAAKQQAKTRPGG
jgi:hypothetical protein